MSEERLNARAAARYEIDADVRLRLPTGSAIRGRISDLSVTGFRLHFVKELKTGTDLWITLPGLASKFATVRWVRYHVAGCVFEAPLYEAVLQHVISLNPPREPFQG